MIDHDPAGFLRDTRPWHSSSDGQPTLRGRRRDHAGTNLHFVHGNGFCAGVYAPLLRELACNDYGLFCHDLEGHGDSDPPKKPGGPDHATSRILAVIDEQKLRAQPLIGMGHSYGAALTVLAAAREPTLFKALVLLDPILLPPAVWLASRGLGLLGRNPMARSAARRRDRWPDAATVSAHLHGRGVYRGWTDEAFACFVAHATRAQDGARVLRCGKDVEAANFAHPPYPWRALRKVRCPVLFLYGTDSYPFMPRSAQLARRHCASLVVQTQAGGHCFMLEAPQQTAAIIRDFLARS